MKKQTQTPDTTNQSYVEPVGFKGTTGEWKAERHEIGKYFGNIVSHWKEEDRNMIRTIDVLLNNAPESEMDANAKLISQSKEIAKALDKWQKWFCTGMNELDGAAIYEESQRVLKEAGLTNE